MSYCNPINFKIKADAAAVGSEYLKYYISCSIRIALFNEKLLRSWQQKRVQKKKKGHILGDEKISIYLRGVDYNVTLAS